MKVVKGDLIKLALEGKFDVIIHGCNCFCTMGAGIAKSIREIFPEAYQADLNTEYGSKEKLGTISYVAVTRENHEITVVNGYTQYTSGSSGILVDYDAVRLVMREAKILFTGRRIGFPMIGAGLAKGDWAVIEEIIKTELEGEDHTLVQFVP